MMKAALAVCIAALLAAPAVVQPAMAFDLIDLLTGKVDAQMKADRIRKEQLASIFTGMANSFDSMSYKHKLELCLSHFPNALARQVVTEEAEKKLTVHCRRLAASRESPTNCPLGLTEDKRSCWRPAIRAEGRR